MPRFSKGFTLVELIATMVIMSILATSVINSYSSYNKWQDINEQVLDIVNTLRQARDYCMAANEKLYLTVTTGDTDSYTLKYKEAKDDLNLPGKDGKDARCQSAAPDHSGNAKSSDIKGKSM